AMRADAHRLLAPQFAEVLDRTVQPFLQPIHDVESARLAHGRVALMGDAGFVARPHVGMGVTKAAEDACSIADAIREHGANPAALRVYAAQRLPAARRVLQRARDLGAYMQAQGRERGAAVERDARSVLELTAIDPASLPLATA
ncbi:MAG: FAD-dependent monooxygenase, partial [Burkholderiaceae bacterium]